MSLISFIECHSLNTINFFIECQSFHITEIHRIPNNELVSECHSFHSLYPTIPHMNEIDNERRDNLVIEATVETCIGEVGVTL